VEPDRVSRDEICVVAAAPSITPWSVRRERASLRQGAVDAVFATVASLEDIGQAVTGVAQWLRAGEDPGLPVRVATSVAEIHAAKAAGDTAVVLHFQGSEPLRAGAELVGAFARLGVRVIQPTYNYRGAAGDGCCEPENAGLSLFGKALVKAMNQHRIAVDIAHAGIRTSLEAIECSTRPVIASHANARAVCEHPRNLPDEVIKAVAASGGVIGLCAFPSFVSAGPIRPLTSSSTTPYISPTWSEPGTSGSAWTSPTRERKSMTSTATTSGTTPGRRGCGHAASNGFTSAVTYPPRCKREASPRTRPQASWARTSCVP
jgi:microsomal dipeptidase-like Zn-dependent dipeptidase